MLNSVVKYILTCLLVLSSLFLQTAPGFARGLFAMPASVFTVTNTNDSGPGSLRQAIEDANANPGADTIRFSIGSGAKTIAPYYMLPLVTDPVIFDGTTQPGYSGRPIVELTGYQFGGVGLSITGGGSTVRGLLLNRFGNAINLNMRGNNKVENCFIGVERTGMVAESNTSSGIIIISSPGNRIGGTSPGMGNLISGNLGAGIEIRNNSPGTLVQGNYLGTDINGNYPVAFFETHIGSGTGIAISGSDNTVIGGTEPGARNIISGNNRGGIDIQNSAGTIIKGNIIGTDAAGRYALANNKNGIEMHHTRNTVIGGTEPGARNIISGNKFGPSGSGNGILIMSNGNSSTVTADNVIRGNYIGVGEDGVTSIPNSDNGVIIVNATNTIIGGSEPGAGNIVANNTFAGVRVFSDTNPPGRGNLISRNLIFSNGDLGIDIGSGGPTPNDPADVDTGVNELQNYPVLTSAHSSSGVTTVIGNLNGMGNTAFTIEFFVNSSCEAGGIGEGQSFAGSTQVKNWGNDSPIYATLPFPALVGQFITATAIDPLGNTSEFSQCMVVTDTAPPPPTVPTPALLTAAGSEEVLALESVTFLRGPFPVEMESGVGGERRTRVMLFAANVELLSGEGTEAVTVQAEDPLHQSYALPVEFVGKVPNYDLLTQLVVQLPEVVPVGDLRVSVTVHGKTSNQVTLRLR
ncbi:MAG TPA: hypothetical protein VMS31_14425 [Pyrinomonadaceae bacterium]|nr:hypothetical protein [Pyrinomonadaceae bacterium]